MRCPRCSSENPAGYTACASCGAAAATYGGVSQDAPTGDRPVFDDSKTAQFAGQLPPEQDVVAGRFEIRSELGRGGSGMVYRAWDRTLRMDVALKLLQPGFVRDPVAVERLKREIIAARRVSHKNVIRINEFGFDDREAFVAMEYLTGGSLSDLLEEGPPDIARGAQIAMGICEGLAAAHEAGVIHRDLKPENVLFDSAGIPKLVDFGLARLGDASNLTVGFSGTPFYMSPEQGNGNEITPKSDVYSMGVLLFELFTGQVPFHADSLVRIALLHAQQPPPPPRSLRPDLPAPLEALILHALQKEPASRPTAPELLDRILDFAAMSGSSVHLPRLARVTTGTGIPVPSPAAQPAPGTAAPPEPRRRSPALFAGLALLLVAGGLGGAWKTGLFAPAATPAPSPTPIAIASATPVSTATPAPATEPAPTKTLLAAATRTPVPAPSARPTLRTVITAVPTPVEPAPVATGTLTVFSYPSVQVWVGSRKLASGTPARALSLPAGKHVVRFVNESLSYAAEFPVVIAANADTKLRVDVEKGTISRE